MTDWKAGMAFDSILQTPLDFYDVTYANGHTVRYEKERQHGEWIKKYKDDDATTVCSVCGFDTGDKVYFNFCPNCGTDMRKRGEENE